MNTCATIPWSARPSQGQVVCLQPKLPAQFMSAPLWPPCTAVLSEADSQDLLLVLAACIATDGPVALEAECIAVDRVPMGSGVKHCSIWRLTAAGRAEAARLAAGTVLPAELVAALPYRQP